MPHFYRKIFAWLVIFTFCLSQSLLASGVPLEFNPDDQPTADPSQNASSDGSQTNTSQTTTQFLEGQSDPLSPSSVHLMRTSHAATGQEFFPFQVLSKLIQATPIQIRARLHSLLKPLAVVGNSDGKVDAADYVVWRKNLGWQSSGPGDTNIADFDGNGKVEQTDYLLWRSQFGGTQPTIEMAFSQDGVNFTPFEPFAGEKMITLEGSEGEKTIFVRFRDEAGNVEDVSATIILDQTPPEEIRDYLLRHTFLNPTAGVSDYFGALFVAVGNNLLVSVRNDDTGVFNSGAVYLFQSPQIST
jgi:hypothetical protein